MLPEHLEDQIETAIREVKDMQEHDHKVQKLLTKDFFRWVTSTDLLTT